jgi:hypothetical protein
MFIQRGTSSSIVGVAVFLAALFALCANKAIRRRQSCGSTAYINKERSLKDRKHSCGAAHEDTHVYIGHIGTANLEKKSNDRLRSCAAANVEANKQACCGADVKPEEG